MSCLPDKVLSYQVPPSPDEKPLDNREKLLSEILLTERSYVQSLEKLQVFQNEVHSQGILSKELVSSMFTNLNDLVEFQRSFLLSLEESLSQPLENQRLGQVFISNESGFSHYQVFCSNYKLATELSLSKSSELAVSRNQPCYK